MVDTIHTNIMRRIYYTYALRLVLHPVTQHLVLLAIFGFALKQLVHVAMVYKVIAQVQVAELFPTLVSIVTHADLPTLIVLGVCIFTALSLPIQLRRIHLPLYQMSHSR